jgi:SAM-dependent methyltransferase
MADAVWRMSSDLAAGTDEALAAAYAQMPYESNPFFESHPGRLATMAYLSGLEPAALERCRVLELGCASGGNLLPAAEALPGATFVGVDLAPNQIADGRAVAEAVGLKNVRLEAMSLGDIPGDFGQFDYIIAHGLYSWVSPEVRARLMDVCKTHLVPGGVAYVSYNTNPGWRLRGTIRDLLLFGLDGGDGETSPEPRGKLPRARAFAELIAEAIGDDDDSDYARVLKREAAMVIKAPDSYIAHEHLELWQQAVYFREFVADAARHGLAYLGEARRNHRLVRIEMRLRQLRPQLAADPIRMEQCIDFVFGRQFRRSLLVHAGTTVRRDLDAERLMRCHLTGGLFPTGQVDLRPDVGVEFKGSDGGTFTTKDTALKVAIAVLAKEAPSPVSFTEAWEKVREVLRLPFFAPAREQLGRMLLFLFAGASIDAHVTPPVFVRRVSPRPVASPLARWQVAHRRNVHNRRHRMVRTLTEFDKKLLPLLDGTRDWPALRATVMPAGGDAGEADRELRDSLQRLGTEALLIG